MEALLLDIVDALRANPSAPCLSDATLVKLINRRNRGKDQGEKRFSKRGILPFYLRAKQDDPALWEGWGIDGALEGRLLRTIQLKPRRTQSGVATVTVLTKPWKCANNCLYCPNDLRMPKSYLHNEPACQRAEQNYFDPYLQVALRLRALEIMGHATDKVELIVLGGTWSDYPKAYQRWFVSELYRALNEAGTPAATASVKERRQMYERAGFSADPGELAEFTRAAQANLHVGARTYNQAMTELYETGEPWCGVAETQVASWEDVAREHAQNEGARRRAVGLVVETRPDAITVLGLALLRRLGCTKIQMGVQSLDERVLHANRRNISVARIAEAFGLCRLFGFKLHVHAMVNLLGSSPEADKADYLRLVSDPAFLPDEVKIYPCALIDDTDLMQSWRSGAWAAYPEEDLLDVLVADVLATPPYVRVSRMIRDISGQDIVEGNKKTNLRQLVERRIAALGVPVQEIRYREVGERAADPESLSLSVFEYETAVSSERFLQGVTPEGKVAGFLRLSLPRAEAVQRLRQRDAGLPPELGEAMIREVHVYGRAAEVGAGAQNAQHLGLGKRLIERACALALAAGYARINVISSVGTREYYRSLGFADKGLYQQRGLGGGAGL